MATAKAFGQITIVDLTDIGEFSATPMSNMPLMIVYDPDTNSYVPNWSDTNKLVLTPIINYAGTQLSNTASGLTITWSKMIGTTASSLSTGETVSNGVLSVASNQFSSSVSLVTYILNASYVEPESGTTLNASGQITFSLVKNSSSVRNISISGDNVFKYDTNSTPDRTSITLTADFTSNLVLQNWQYKHPNDTTWHDTGIGTQTITIANDSSYFNHTENGVTTSYDIISVRAVGEDNTNTYYYDTIQVYKLRDGAAGQSAISLVLSNESQMIPCDSSGNPTSSGNLATTTVQLYIEGVIDNTHYDDIIVTPNGVGGTWSAPTYTVTSWSGSSDTAYVTFQVTLDGSTVTKQMNLTKVKTGADGKSPTIYELEPDVLAINKSETGDYTPNTLTLNFTQTTGTTTTKAGGYLEIYKDDETDPVGMTISTTDGAYSIADIKSVYAPTKYLIFKFYASKNGTLLDTQTVVVTNDGATGASGAQGNSAINVILGNPADSFSVTSSYTMPAQRVVEITFDAYEGTTKIPCSVSGTLPTLFGVSGTQTAADKTQTGKITYTIPAGKATGSSTVRNGTLSFTFISTASSGTTTTIHNYSWSVIPQPENGSNAILFQLFAPHGNTFLNGSTESLTIQGSITDGTDVTESGTNWIWGKYIDDGYVDFTSSNAGGITGYDTSILTVTKDDIDSYASFRCKVNYGDNNDQYVQYFSLFDKTDPLQVTLISTVGNQILNGNGVGAVYAIVTRNGVEVDSMPDDISFVTSKPSELTTGNYYYLLTKSTKTATLYKATSATAWSAVSNSSMYTGKYTWSFRDKDNNVLEDTSSIPSTDDNPKVIYIDADLINKKIIIDVEVNY